ncbi:MAG: M15 family metallopeptidase, partial [Bacteroidota bacterium]
MRMLFYMLVLSISCFLAIMACGEQTATTSEISDEQQEPTSIDSLPAPQIQISGAEERLQIDYLRGQFEPSTHPQFERVADRYTDGDGSYYLHQAAYAAFKEMHAAAALDSVPLTIISATRNFERQRSIWEAKWRGERLLEGREKANEVYPDPADRARAILRYSSMPGTSRHHWGSDLDLNRLTNEYFGQGLGKKVYDWLQAHAASYGFCQPYTAGRPHGYLEERWHWSYLPLAQPLTDFAREQATDEMIEGFEGAESSTQIS